jgi:[ribosomal protein S18]-alanine N-acetyltransferase
MRTPLKIRAATPTDVPAIIELQRRAVTASQWSQQQYEALFENQGARRLSLVLEENSSVQAFVTARGIGPEWELENIAVAGPARRRGLGTRLLGEFLKIAGRQGAQLIHLEVRESNRAARVLYEKWAFQESGRRRQYYREPDEDAITYVLQL